VNRRGVVVGAAVVVVVVIVGVAVLVNRGNDSTRHAPASSTRGDGTALGDAIAAARPASTPFAGLTEVRLRVGTDRCLKLAVADSYAERVAGLRDTAHLGSYDGMLFVHQTESASAFTMSGVTVPLDIAFYRRDGSRDSSRAMKPCPKAQQECPAYRSDGPFLYAVETHEGQLPGGPISPCPSSS
jgi:uncharacterized membrane protein (UPF0127 family)